MSLVSESADPCDVTLATHEAVADAYAEQNREPDPVVVPLLDRLAALVGDGRLLALGSGPGTDADHLHNLGARVIRSDAAGAFVEMMRARGIDARRLDVRTGDFGGPYDAVLANAVLLHLRIGCSSSQTDPRSPASAAAAGGRRPAVAEEEPAPHSMRPVSTRPRRWRKRRPRVRCGHEARALAFPSALARRTVGLHDDEL